MTHGRVQSFASGRKLGHADQQSALVKIGALLPESDFNRWFAADAVAVPVGDGVLRRAIGRRVAVNAAEILGRTRVRNVLLAPDHEQTRRRKKGDRNMVRKESEHRENLFGTHVVPAGWAKSRDGHSTPAAA